MSSEEKELVLSQLMSSKIPFKDALNLLEEALEYDMKNLRYHLPLFVTVSKNLSTQIITLENVVKVYLSTLETMELERVRKAAQTFMSKTSLLKIIETKQFKQLDTVLQKKVIEASEKMEEEVDSFMEDEFWNQSDSEEGSMISDEEAEESQQDE